MAGKQCADIVFCIDASGSMQHTFNEVCKHIGDLIDSLQGGSQMKWDVRFDFLAFSSGNDMHLFSSVNLSGVGLMEALYKKAGNNQEEVRLFTRDIEKFKTALRHVEVGGEESHLLALDCALDYPWRSGDDCHRVVVLLSDEPVETGILVADQIRAVPDMIDKLHSKKIKLFIIAPESDTFYELSSADRSEYEIVDGQQHDGLKNVNFSKMLAAIGKSVSVSQTSIGASNAPLPLFKQDGWIAAQGDLGQDNH